MENSKDVLLSYGIIGSGTVSSNGTVFKDILPFNWKVSKTATGTYQIKHYIGDVSYGTLVTAVSSSPIFCTVDNQLQDFCIIKTYSNSGTLTDSQFSFSIFTKPKI